MNSRNAAKICTLMGLVALTAGCGSGGEQSLGTNSRTEVYLESTAIEDLDLIVAEQQGLPTDPGVCSNNQVNFGCTRQFGPASTIISFTTRSIASTQPYLAYVRNNGGSEHRFLIIVTMDDNEKYRATGTVAAGDTFLIARINRNSAGEP
jgi:hypothetical protein